MPSPQEVARDPALFAAAFLKILNKRNKLVPFRWNTAQADFHRNRTGRDLILKARQLGFSTLIQGEMYRRTVTSTRSTITLAHDADTTTKLRLMADRFWEHCNFDGIRPARKYANATLTTYPEMDSTATIATAGSIDAGRGGTYSDFHGSEVAFWKDARRLIAGAMQGGEPDVVLESTPNGAQGYFYERCMEAIHGKGNWHLHFYPWWWDPAYKLPLEKDETLEYTPEEQKLVMDHDLTPEQIKWRRDKHLDLGELFPQEYPEDPVTCFLTSGRSYFGNLANVFTAPAGARWVEGRKYAGGLDFGQAGDFTALSILDFTTKRQADLLHLHGLEWAEIRKRIKEKYLQWHLESILAEANSIGSPNIEALRNMGVNIQAFETTNKSKASIISSLNEGIHHGGWKLLDLPVQKNEFNTFVSTQLPSGAWRLAAEGQGHDDTVIANALALRAGQFVVTDEEMEAYGRGEISSDDFDQDMLEYAAESRGITLEEAMAEVQEREEARRVNQQRQEER